MPRSVSALASAVLFVVLAGCGSGEDYGPLQAADLNSTDLPSTAVDPRVCREVVGGSSADLDVCAVASASPRGYLDYLQLIALVTVVRAEGWLER